MPARFGERALHQQLADADAKAAADQLGEQEAPGVSSSSQYGATRCGLLLGRQAAQRQQALLDPLGQAEVARARRRRQHVRDGLGEVADRLVALVEQPVGDAGALAGDRAQQRRSAPPGAACRRRGSTPPRRRRAARPRRSSACSAATLSSGRGARVELGEEAGEALHDAPSACRRQRRRRRLLVVVVAVLGLEGARLAGPARPASAPSPPRSRG